MVSEPLEGDESCSRRRVRAAATAGRHGEDAEELPE